MSEIETLELLLLEEGFKVTPQIVIDCYILMAFVSLKC